MSQQYSRRKGKNSTDLEVETELNKAQIDCSRVLSAPDHYADAHYKAREMTVPVLDRQSGVPIRV